MNIVVFGQLSSSVISAMEQKHQVVCFPHRIPDYSALLGAAVLITRGHIQITAEILGQAPHLRLLVKAGSGVDNIDLAETTKRGIKVVTTPASTHAVVELTFALLLAVRRNLCFMNDQIRKGNWEAKYRHPGHQLHGSTLGIVGFGRIGSEVARLGAAFGMRILVYDRSPTTPSKQAALLASKATATDLSTLLSQADAVSLHLPLLPETRHLIGSSGLELMRSDSVLINTGRAAVVDKQALILALQEGKIAGAGLDVFHEEPIAPDDLLLALPQVVCTPHIGAQTLEAMNAIGQQVLAVINEFEDNTLRETH